MGCLMEEFNRRHFSSIPTSEDEPGGLPRHQKAQSRGKVALGSSLILSFQRFHLPFSQPASAAIKSPQRRLMSRAIPSLLRPGGVARFPLPPPHLTRSRATSLISGLHAVVVCLLLGAVVLVVGLVQLVPGATTTNHRLALLVAGAALLILGFILAGVRCYVLHCVPLPVESPIATPIPPTTGEQAPVVPKGTLDLLVGHQNQPETDALMQHREHHHHHQHHSYHHHNNHKKKRSSQGSHSEEA
ncbi:PREDICTED: uncharacterized protein LOC105620824 [Atta cephalotes]|uniref:Uncharacterized protein n=1 Tax=Atta cephalotes TaxID=12957 RepID=A0A158NJI5_ATTCE|nr:PREDICTED: uncharacterized protein LOC105620824 [Atta cephalotes]